MTQIIAKESDTQLEIVAGTYSSDQKRAKKKRTYVKEWGICLTPWRPAVIFVKTFSDMKIQTEPLNDREHRDPLSHSVKRNYNNRISASI